MSILLCVHSKYDVLDLVVEFIVVEWVSFVDMREITLKCVSLDPGRIEPRPFDLELPALPSELPFYSDKFHYLER